MKLFRLVSVAKPPAEIGHLTQASLNSCLRGLAEARAGTKGPPSKCSGQRAHTARRLRQRAQSNSHIGRISETRSESLLAAYVRSHLFVCPCRERKSQFATRASRLIGAEMVVAVQSVHIVANAVVVECNGRRPATRRTRAAGAAGVD